MFRHVRILVAGLLLMAAAVQGVSAQTWVDYATVSMTNPTTPKLLGSRLCYSDATDIACDGAAGLLLTSGTLQITNISATALTVGGVAVGGAGDRIVATNANVVAMPGGTVSITTGGTSGTAYFGSTGLLVGPGISATQNVSSFTTVYASGNVGIGTTTPAYPLDVSGTGVRSTASGSGYSVLQPGSWAATGFVGFYTSSTARLGYVGWGVLNSTMSLMTDTSVTSLGFGTSSTTRMLIDSSGNVGIGTMAPTASLQVAGTGFINSGILVTESRLGFTNLRIGGGGAGVGTSPRLIFDHVSDTAPWQVDNEGGNFRWYRPGVVYMQIASATGNVGLGTTTANVRLDVSGSIVSRPSNAGSGTTIDFSLSNLIYSSAACGAITLQNMQDGGTYTLVLTGSGTGPASFTHSGLTVKTNTTLSCTSAKHTVFTFLRAGSNVYVNMSTGF